MIWIAVVALAVRWIYRPLIDHYGLDDFGLAGILPSFLGVLLFTVVLAHWLAPRHAAVGCIVAALVYEFEQRGSNIRSFDPWDLVASVFGGVVGYLLLCKLGRDERRAAAETAGA